MSGFEINKILASIVLALIMIFGISYVGNLIVNVDHKENQVSAYKINIPESDMNTQMVVNEETEIIEPIGYLFDQSNLKGISEVYKEIFGNNKNAAPEKYHNYANNYALRKFCIIITETPRFHKNTFT